MMMLLFVSTKLRHLCDFVCFVVEMRVDYCNKSCYKNPHVAIVNWMCIEKKTITSTPGWFPDNDNAIVRPMWC